MKDFILGLYDAGINFTFRHFENLKEGGNWIYIFHKIIITLRLFRPEEMIKIIP